MEIVNQYGTTNLYGNCKFNFAVKQLSCRLLIIDNLVVALKLSYEFYQFNIKLDNFVIHEILIQ